MHACKNYKDEKIKIKNKPIKLINKDEIYNIK